MVTTSYFDTDLSSATDGVGAGTIITGLGKTTAKLQEALAYGGIYEAWNIDVDNADMNDDITDGVDDPWDFGTSSQYPALKADFDGSGFATAYEFGVQGRSVPILAITNVDPMFGVVGTMVTIDGQSFDATPANNTVTFLGTTGGTDDAVVVNVTVISDGELIVEVPEGAVTGLIQVEANGATAVSASDFTVKPELPNNGDLSLIDITNLDQLDAMRYDLDGDGVAFIGDEAAYLAAFGTPSCASSCTGYELMESLDFEDAASYAGSRNEAWVDPAGGTATEGWPPIRTFNAVFEGNDHTISNLYINRTTSYIGLLGSLSSGGEVRNLGIEGGSVTGQNNVGGLVGNNAGTISMCYATGTVAGGNYVGGFVGANNGTISMCYATGTVAGEDYVGGFAGDTHQGPISACYATGNAEATARVAYVGGFMGYNNSSISACYATGAATATGNDANVGGFVGNNDGTISACYATGDATTATGSAGGLVGYNENGTINNSYFDYSVSNRPASDSYSKTTTELITPTMYDDDITSDNGSSIYEVWNVDVDNADTDDDLTSGVDDPWDFGTSSEYPALKVDFDGDTDATAYEFGGQGRSAPLTITTVDPMFGFVGTMVTIEGQSFDATPANNTVTFLGDDGDNADDRVATVNTASTTVPSRRGA